MAIEIVDLPIYPLIAWWFSIVFCMFTRGYYVYFQYSTEFVQLERLSSWKPIRVQPSVNPPSRPTPDCQQQSKLIEMAQNITGWWFQSLWKIESVGMIIPNVWKNNPNVPNHQPDHRGTWKNQPLKQGHHPPSRKIDDLWSTIKWCGNDSQNASLQVAYIQYKDSNQLIRNTRKCFLVV
jgi:hypothetical protein